MDLSLECSNVSVWKEALSSYDSQIESMNKPDLIPLDRFYRHDLPSLIHQRNPNPHITASELTQLMRWKLTRGKWRPRLLNFVASLDDASVKSASQKAFECLPDISQAVKELTVLKGVGAATSSAVLAAYAPDVAPFMSDEAMEAALRSSKDYSLTQYLVFVDKLKAKAKELSSQGDTFTPSDVERALWSSAVAARSLSLRSDTGGSKAFKRKRKR